MAKKYTPEELNDLSRQELILLVTSMQENLEQLNANMEKLIEQISIANQQRFGRHSERLDVIDGQLNLFNEAEALSEEAGNALEPSIDEVLPQQTKKKKKAGTRDADLSGLPEETIMHSVPGKKLIEHFGEGCYRKLPDESCKRLRYTPASWTVELHTVEVYVGTDGLRQDEFLRGDRPADLLHNSIVTPSLEAAILNGKYVNSIPLYRMEQEFQRNGVYISRQNMAN